MSPRDTSTLLGSMPFNSKFSARFTRVSSFASVSTAVLAPALRRPTPTSPQPAPSSKHSLFLKDSLVERTNS